MSERPDLSSLPWKTLITVTALTGLSILSATSQTQTGLIPAVGTTNLILLLVWLGALPLQHRQIRKNTHLPKNHIHPKIENTFRAIFRTHILSLWWLLIGAALSLMTHHHTTLHTWIPPLTVVGLTLHSLKPLFAPTKTDGVEHLCLEAMLIALNPPKKGDTCLWLEHRKSRPFPGAKGLTRHKKTKLRIGLSRLSETHTARVQKSWLF